MMKKGSLFFVLMQIILSGWAASPPLKNWQKCLGGSQQDVPAALIQSNDGNVILLSNVDSQNGDILFNHGSTDIWITKLTSSGSLLWQKSIGGSSIDAGTSISELADGRLIITGYTASTDGDFQNNKGNFDVFWMCTDNNGNVLSLKNYGGSQVDLCYAHKKTSDGGFILVGGSYSLDGDVSGNHGNQDSWIMKVDSLGNLLWQNSTGGTNIDVFYSVTTDASGNIYAGGTSNSVDGDVMFNHGNYDMLVAKYDFNGSNLWTKAFGGSNFESAQTILIDSRQNILIGGYSRSSNGEVSTNYGYTDSWLIRIDCFGNLQSEKNFGGSGAENLFSIIETIDGGYLLTSGSTSTDRDILNFSGMEDIWLLKTDNSFNTEWSRNYGGSGSDRPVSVFQDATGGFLIAGYTFSNNNDVSGQHGSSDIWLLSLVCKNPIAYFSSPSSVCGGDTLNLVNSSADASEISWTLNNTFLSRNQSIQLLFPLNTIRTVTLTASTCYNTDTYSESISSTNCNLPQVNFSAQSTVICANSQVAFLDATPNATSWIWNFQGGNPAVSTLKNPQISYSQPGVYSVTLTAINSFGNQTLMKLNFVTVKANPAIPLITLSGNELSSTQNFQYQWYYNNASIPSENGQTFMAFLEGEYKVAVMNSDQCSSQSNTIYFSTTGIEEDKYMKDLSVFPNPTVNNVQIRIPTNSTGNLKLISADGKLLLEKNIEIQTRNFNLDLSNYESGIYMIVYVNEKGKLTQRTIIKN